MTKLRGVAYALLLVSVLAALVPVLGLAGPSQVTVSGNPVAAASSPVAVRREQSADQRAKASEAREQKQQAQEKARKAREEAEKRVAQKTKTPEPSQAPSGPDLNREVEEADAATAKSKLIVGGIAVVLGAIVFFGHRARSASRRKAKAQAAGK